MAVERSLYRPNMRSNSRLVHQVVKYRFSRKNENFENCSISRSKGEVRKRYLHGRQFGAPERAIKTIETKKNFFSFVPIF